MAGGNICQYYLRGRCAFGSNCRNIHSSVPSQAQQKQPNAESENTYAYDILQKHWNQLAWKGSPLWIPERSQPVFLGLDLSVEESRWEFYKYPQNEWFKLQAYVDSELERARENWLHHYRLGGLSAACLNDTKVQFNSNNFPTLRQSNIFDASSSMQMPTGRQESSFVPTLSEKSLLEVNQPNFSCPSGSLFESFPQTSSILTDVTFQTTNISNSPLINNNGFEWGSNAPNVDDATKRFHTINLINSSVPANNVVVPNPNLAVNSESNYNLLYQRQAEELKLKYRHELNNYALWELIAFLSPEFEDGKIPLKPPPPLPEFS